MVEVQFSVEDDASCHGNASSAILAQLEALATGQERMENTLRLFVESRKLQHHHDVKSEVRRPDRTDLRSPGESNFMYLDIVCKDDDVTSVKPPGGSLEVLGAAHSKLKETIEDLCNAEMSVELAIEHVKNDLNELAASGSEHSKEGPTFEETARVSQDTITLERGVESHDSNWEGNQQNKFHQFPPSWPSDIERRQGLDFRGQAHRTFIASAEANTLYGSFVERNAPPSHSFKWCVLSPIGGFRTLLDLTGAVLLMVDMFVIPFMLAWDQPVEDGFIVLSWFTACFWALEFCANFSTGYYEEGACVMSRRMAALHYLKTWFVLDLLTVCCDWTSLLFRTLSSNGTGYASDMLRIAKVSRLLRIVGVLRMFRMMRLARVSEELTEQYVTDEMRLAVKLASTFAVVMWVNHIISCIWYALGQVTATDTGTTWVQTSIELSNRTADYQDLGNLYLYATSFHWSMAQMTLGATEIVATNSIERAYHVAMLLTGMIFSSTLVSSLSATMIKFQMDAEERHRQLRTLRDYLRQHKVDGALAIRVRKQAESRSKTRELLVERDVSALALLSTSVRNELRYDIFKPYLLTHPLFRLVSNLSQVTSHNLCMLSVDFLSLQPKDDLFTAGSLGEHMYFVVSGDLRYTQYPPSSPVTFRKKEDVPPESWLCEAALWTMWVHVGTAIAAVTSRLVTINSVSFVQAMKKHGIVEDIIREYSRIFHMRVMQSSPPESEWPNDLHVPMSDFGSIVNSMKHEMQEVIGYDALAHVAPSFPWPTSDLGKSQNLDHLKKEVQDGKSTVVLNSDGEPERIVQVIVLNIRDDATEMSFVQLAKLSEVTGKWLPSCVLPGAKPEMNERVADAVDRVIATKLENIKSVVKVVRTERVSECHQSHRFLVPTHYLRTVCHAKLVGDFQAPTFVMGGNTPVKQLATRLTYTWNPVAIHSMDRGSYATHRWDASQDQFISAMIHREVYCFAHEGGATFLYVWLKNSEFEFAKNAANRHVLEHWIGNLETHPRELVLPRVNSGCTELSRASRSGSTDSSLGSVGVDISVLESEDFSERHRNITSL